MHPLFMHTSQYTGYQFTFDCSLLSECVTFVICCSSAAVHTLFSVFELIFLDFLSIVVSLPVDRLKLMNCVQRLCVLLSFNLSVQFSYSLCIKEVLISILGCLNLRLGLLYILSAAKKQNRL